MEFPYLEDKMEENLERLDLSGVEETALLTLYARAIESQSDNPIIQDKQVEKIVEKLDQVLQNQNSKMAKRLMKRAVDPKLTVHLQLRAKNTMITRWTSSLSIQKER